MGHRVALLRDGRLQQVDTPRNIYDRPVNAFVAEFIGSPAMNMRSARLTEDGALLGQTQIRLPSPALAAAKAAGLEEVTVGLRPEALSSVAVNGDGPALAMEVRLVEELGSDAYVYGSLAGEEASGKPYAIRLGGNALPRIGEAIRVVVPEAAAHVFNPSTGERLG